MSDYTSEFTFTLSKPIKIAVKGQLEEVNELLLFAPSNKQRREACKLEQGFFRALKSMADDKGDVAEAAKDDGKTITGDEVLSIIMMSDVDFDEYQEIFKKLLLSGICKVFDETFVPSMYDLMNHNDTSRLMGEYLANFLLASHLAKMSQK